MVNTNSSFELILLIGDSDFAPGIGYNWQAIEAAVKNGATLGNFDEEIFATNSKAYSNYLIKLLNFNRVQNGKELFQAVENDIEITSPRIIRVVSLYDLYKKGTVPNSSDNEFDSNTIDGESEVKYTYFQTQLDRYDINFFSKISKEQAREITLGKFKSYRDQGMLIKQMGGILLADELPPTVKAQMYRNGLLMMWPWIRKEAPERNPDYAISKPPKVRLIEPPLEE